MEVTLGIDIGTSATKLVCVRRDKGVLSRFRIRTEEAQTGVYSALDHVLRETGLKPDSVRQIALTGLGASCAEGDVRGIPTRRIGEFDAAAAGALAAAGQESALVVSMGTGTAFVWAKADGTVEHLCGTGVGGGTLEGLCRVLTGTGRFSRIQELAEAGDRFKVNLAVGDVSRNLPPTLDPTLTAANFGRVSEDASPADLAAGAANLVLEAVGIMMVLAARCCDTKTVVLTGSVTELSLAKANFENFERLYGLRCIIPEHAAFATAFGAALCALRTELA